MTPSFTDAAQRSHATDRKGAPLRIAVLISGRGSNMLAIADACAAQRIRAQVVAVIADSPNAAGLDAARARGIPTHHLTAKSYADRCEFDTDLSKLIDSHQPGVVVLAGFMRILGEAFVAARVGALLNIHPSLLPIYPGLHTHRRALAERTVQHGATVHYVTKELDGGPAVLQGRLKVRPDDTETTLSARVNAIEHIIYPRVLDWLASGRLVCPNGAPMLDGNPLHSPLLEDFDV